MAKLIQSGYLLIAFMSVTSALSTVILGSAENYVLLAKSGITTTGSTDIVGNMGVSPAAATSMTGFGLILSPDGTSSTSSLVDGTIHAADYSSPTPSTLTTAISDMEAAYTDAAGRLNPDSLNLLGGNLNGITLTQGLHRWDSAVTMGGNISISGSSADIFIIQISGTLDFDNGSRILLVGGAKSSNLFYQVAGAVTFGSSAAAQGIILGKGGISFGSGASLDSGRALAQTAVTLIGNTIKNP